MNLMQALNSLREANNIDIVWNPDSPLKEALVYFGVHHKKLAWRVTHGEISRDDAINICDDRHFTDERGCAMTKNKIEKRMDALIKAFRGV